MGERVVATKHEQILKYIENLAVGEKISVRKIAKNLSVSEGTAYRAIKDAEIIGFVSTIKRVGTLRIERKQKDSIEKLTFAEIVNMIDGQVLGGRAGLYKSLNKFVYWSNDSGSDGTLYRCRKLIDCRKQSERP